MKRAVAGRRARGVAARVGGARAFTLIELVAVIVILGIVAVSVAPVLGGSTRAARRAGATQIARDVAYARERALATGRRVWVSVSVDGLGYELLADDPGAPGRAGAVSIRDVGGSDGFVVVLDEGVWRGVRIGGVEVDGGGRDVGFDWLGRAVRGDGVALTSDARVSVEGGATVVVRAGSGLVEVVGDGG